MCLKNSSTRSTRAARIERDHLTTPIVDSKWRGFWGGWPTKWNCSTTNQRSTWQACRSTSETRWVWSDLFGSLGERHWAKGYELGYSRHMPSLAEALAIIDRIRPELAALRVVRIGIFGSVARGTSRSNSDVDCLVQLADKGSLFDLISVKQLLEEAFGCPVDVVTPRGLKADVRDAVLGEVRYAA